MNELTKDIFPERLAALRAKKGISRQTAADDLGISRASLEYYEKGQRVPDIVVLSKIADYFEVSADYLIGHSNVESIDPSGKMNAAGEVTGLSEKAINTLIEIQAEENNKDLPLNEIISAFISNPLFKTMANQIINTVNLLNSAVDDVELLALSRILGVSPKACNTIETASKLSAENVCGISRLVIDEVLFKYTGKHLLMEFSDMIVIENKNYISNMIKGGD